MIHDHGGAGQQSMTTAELGKIVARKIPEQLRRSDSGGIDRKTVARKSLKQLRLFSFEARMDSFYTYS